MSISYDNNHYTSDMIYVLQTKMYQNIAKLLTHSNISLKKMKSKTCTHLKKLQISCSSWLEIIHSNVSLFHAFRCGIRSIPKDLWLMFNN